MENNTLEDITSVVLFCPLCVETVAARVTPKSIRRSALDILRRQLAKAREMHSYTVKMVKIVVLSTQRQEPTISQAVVSAKALCSMHGLPWQVRYLDIPWIS